MDEEILKILEKKINEIKEANKKINEIMNEFPNFDSSSFYSGIMVGRLFNSFYYQYRRILKRSPTDSEFMEFIHFLKNSLDKN
ncbi:MAG: hypothetical protein VX587_03100 [Thermoproteota archaeon]|nr:hypothetical protein [Thermoproteota archaeon]